MKQFLIITGIVLAIVAVMLLIWPGMILVPEYLFVWIMNGGGHR